MLRVLGALLLASTMMMGGAHASSFLVVAPPKDEVNSSFVVIGAPAAVASATAMKAPADAPVVPLAFPLATDGVGFPADQIPPTKITKISTSIIAFDSPVPNVAYENVAAITPDKVLRPASRPLRFRTPMVMRAGIIGDAGATAPSAAAPVASRSSGRNTAKSTARAPVAPRPGEPAPEEPVKIIIAPPPPTMPTLDGVR